MTDEELAEKTAKALGWKQRFNNGRSGWTNTDEQLVELDEFFTWNTFDLIVKKAMKMGWTLETGGRNNNLFFYEYNHFHEKMTGVYSINQEGYIRACALAFLDVAQEEQPKTGEQLEFNFN